LRRVTEALSIAVHSGAFERVHYALVMASAAAASDRKATLFFTGQAVHAVTQAGGRPGWHALAAPPDGAAARDAALRDRRVAGFEELLAACAELKVRMIVCEMALRAAGLDAATGILRHDLPLEVAGVVTFLNQGAGGALLFV
jgi:peroxiredoxin family protein